MSSISPVPLLISAGALLFFCMVNRHQPGYYGRSNAPFCSTQEEQVEHPKPNIQPKYKYRIEVETTPQNQIYKVKKSGYQQYEISQLGESYSYVTYEFISDKVMTTAEAYEFIRKNPDKCTRVVQTTPKKSLKPEENIYDRFLNEYDNYMDDPEDIQSFPDEVFDFFID